MNSSNSFYQINNLNNAVVYIYKYILVVFYVVSNIGNVLSLLIFLKKSWRKNVCVFYFKVCLFFNTCYINSTILGLIFIYDFQINLQNLNIVLCKLYFYASFLFATLSPTVLILASIDRLLISSQNVDTRLYSSKRLAYFSISISTFFWIMFNLHALIEVNIQEISPTYFICSYYFPVSYLYFVSYFLGIITAVFCLLMIILCIFAFKNVRRIRTTLREKRNQIRSMTKKDFQLLHCLFVQDIVYIIFGSLVVIYYIYDAMTQNQIRTAWKQALVNFLDKFFTFLFNISYSTNFFVFMIVSKAFRYEVKRIIYKIIGKNLNPLREEENRQNNIERDDIELNIVVSTIELPA